MTDIKMEINLVLSRRLDDFLRSLGRVLACRLRIGLPTPADEIPGDFFDCLEIPRDFRFLLYKRLSEN